MSHQQCCLESQQDDGGLIITPGLIDLHTHRFWGVSHYVVDPDTSCLARGVTTAIDAGSAGALADHDLDELVMIVSIWIDWAATDQAPVLANTREAMRTALLRADGKEAYAGDFLDDALDALNTKAAMEESQ